MTVEEKIEQIIKDKAGDTEFILNNNGWEELGGKWYCGIGNDCHCVMLGEVGAQIEAYGECIFEALEKLHTMVINANIED